MSSASPQHIYFVRMDTLTVWSNNQKESASLSYIVLTDLGDADLKQLSPLPAVSSPSLWLSGQSQLTTSELEYSERQRGGGGGITELKRRITLIFFNKGGNLSRVSPRPQRQSDAVKKACGGVERYMSRGRERRRYWKVEAQMEDEEMVLVSAPVFHRRRSRTKHLGCICCKRDGVCVCVCVCVCTCLRWKRENFF